MAETVNFVNSSSNNEHYVKGVEKYKITVKSRVSKFKVAGKKNTLIKDFEEGLKRSPEFNRHKYREILSKNLRDNLMIGFISESYLMKDIQHNEGINGIGALREKLNLHSKNFDMLLESDYQSTKSLCMEADSKRRINHDKIETLEKTANNLQSIHLEIGMLQDRYDKCRDCERFLFSISPKSWKTYYNMKFGSIEEALAEERDTEMYFKETAELLMIFSELEEYCYTDILTSNKLEEMAENLIKETLPIDKYYVELIDYLEDKVRRKEESIKAYEKGRMDAEMYANEMVQSSCITSMLASQEYHVTFAHLQDYFHQCFNISNPSLSILEMFRALEAEYKRLQFEEDFLHSGQYRALAGELNVQEQVELSVAKKARKHLKEFDRSTQKLMKIFKPPYKETSTRKLMFRSKIIDETVRKKSSHHIETEGKLLQYFFANENDCDSVTDKLLDLDDMSKYLFDNENNKAE